MLFGRKIKRKSRRERFLLVLNVTVNVKGEVKRWGWKLGFIQCKNILCFYFSLSCLLPHVLRPVLCVFPYWFSSSSLPAFWLPPTSSPEARIYPLVCMQEHMLVCTHRLFTAPFTHPSPQPPISLTCTTQLALCACSKEISEAGKKKERASANGFIYVPVPQLFNISITNSERQTPVSHEM